MFDPQEHYDTRMAQFSTERVCPGGIVLLGSSHFEWFDTDQLIPGLPIVNRGIASDRIGIGSRGILRRLNESVFELHPSCVMMQSGVNDLGELWRTGEPQVETIIEHYERVVASIRERLPEVVLCLISVFPTGGEYEGIKPMVPALNDRIRNIARSFGADYLDFHSHLVDPRDSFRAELTDDGLHLNKVGYDLFAANLKAYINSKLPAIESNRKE